LFVNYKEYILSSPSFGKYYGGHTQVLENRMIEDNGGEQLPLKVKFLELSFGPCIQVQGTIREF